MKGTIFLVLILILSISLISNSAYSFKEDSGRAEIVDKEDPCLGLSQIECYEEWTDHDSGKKFPNQMVFTVTIDTESDFHKNYIEGQKNYGNSTIPYSTEGQKLVVVWTICSKTTIVQPAVQISSDMETRIIEFTGILDGGSCHRPHRTLIQAHDPNSILGFFYLVRLEPDVRGIVILAAERLADTDKWNLPSKICAGSHPAYQPSIVVSSDKEEKEVILHDITIAGGTCYAKNLTIHADDPSSIRAQFKSELDSETELFEKNQTEENISSISIPIWIKINAQLWSEGFITEHEYKEGIRFLIKEGIITVSTTESGTESESKEIPNWLRDHARWWADGLIDDNSFVQGIQFLVKQGIIRV